MGEAFAYATRGGGEDSPNYKFNSSHTHEWRRIRQCLLRTYEVKNRGLHNSVVREMARTMFDC